MNEAVDELLDTTPIGVLGTVRKDGSARLSTVYFVRDGNRVQISTESKRGKARDVERTGHAALCVQGFERPFPYVTLEGRARIVREDVGEPTARILARILDAPVGHAQTDEALAAVDRVILEIDIERIHSAYLQNED